jgi:phage host-nuclease inhibitor protein Gam
MPAPRKKKVVEPVASESLAENIQENVTSADVDVEVETASALALDNIYAAAEGAATTMNDQVADVTEQVAAAQEQVADQVAAVQEQVADQVAAVTEQVAAVQEQVDDQVAAVADQVAAVQEQVAEQVAAVTEQVTAAIQNAEKIIDNIKETIVEKAAQTLADTIMSAIKPGGKDLKIAISKSASNMISSIASYSPAVLDDIKKSLLEVLKDGKIDSNDIPHLISIIQSLYELMCNLKDFQLDSQSRASICAEVLKFISHFLILDDHLCVDQLNQFMFLNQIDTLIDSCVSLLSFSSAIKIEGNCLFPFFCK